MTKNSNQRGGGSCLEQLQQTLKYDFASVNLNLLHVGEDASTSKLKSSPFAETCNVFRR